MQIIESTPIRRAVHLVGGQKALAKQIGVSVQAVHKWIKSGSPPAERCREIEQITGGAVTRYELRADVFGVSPDARLDSEVGDLGP